MFRPRTRVKYFAPLVVAICFVVVTAMLYLQQDSFEAAESVSDSAASPRGAKALASTQDSGPPKKGLVLSGHSESKLSEEQLNKLNGLISKTQQRLREMEKQNTETILELREEKGSSVVIRTQEPTIDQWVSQLDLQKNDIASLHDRAMVAEFQKKLEKLNNDFFRFPPGYPYRVVSLKAYRADDGKMNVSSLQGYFKDVESSTPTPEGRLSFTKEANDISWNSDTEYPWAKKRYSYLFEIEKE